MEICHSSLSLWKKLHDVPWETRSALSPVPCPSLLPCVPPCRGRSWRLPFPAWLPGAKGFWTTQTPRGRDFWVTATGPPLRPERGANCQSPLREEQENFGESKVKVSSNRHHFNSCVWNALISQTQCCPVGSRMQKDQTPCSGKHLNDTSLSAGFCIFVPSHYSNKDHLSSSCIPFHSISCSTKKTKSKGLKQTPFHQSVVTSQSQRSLTWQRWQRPLLVLVRRETPLQLLVRSQLWLLLSHRLLRDLWPVNRSPGDGNRKSDKY